MSGWKNTRGESYEKNKKFSYIWSDHSNIRGRFYQSDMDS